MAQTHERSHHISIGYDHNADALYFNVCKAKKTIARDVGNGVLVLFNAETKEPIGLVIHDFEERFSQKDEPCEVPGLLASLQPA